MTAAEAFAPAKINLTLHVTGQRADGYHLLDSLVMFGDIGDRITVTPASQTRLSVSGPMARDVPADGRNLVLKAATLMGVTADIQLEKHLPVAAGIGGGSADAAATLRALSRLHDLPEPDIAALLELGADVALCMANSLTRMGGVGDRLERLAHCPELSLVLVNPGVAVPTPLVFQALTSRRNDPMIWPMPDPGDRDGWVGWLAAQRNDLEAAAMGIAPVIGDVLGALRQLDGCLLARMSGSGATCFAILRDDRLRERALRDLRRDYPGWWSVACNTSGSEFR